MSKLWKIQKLKPSWPKVTIGTQAPEPPVIEPIVPNAALYDAQGRLPEDSLRQLPVNCSQARGAC